MAITLYWHDYETFGIDPKFDRAVQFAGIRTNEELEEIDQPLDIYCQPPRDRLPQPMACLVTGITPQLATQKGLLETEFCRQLHEQLIVPETCSVGYNSLRFDDEVTRNLLYRNFYDPYAREYQQENSRWDLIDLARMTYALRPEGIHWPIDEEGRPSFRLEKLTTANGIGHESAHDALSDVRATIGLARLFRRQQRRLYDWLFKLRSKHQAIQYLNLIDHTAVVHSSGMYPSQQGCTTLVMPLLAEKINKNSILVYDLQYDPEEFFDLDADELNRRLFSRRDELSEGESRLPVKSVKINKCPALAPMNTLSGEVAERLNINLDDCLRHRNKLLSRKDFMRQVLKAYSATTFPPSEDVEGALYDRFIPDTDRQLSVQIRQMRPEALATQAFSFQDDRMPELLFRYRARNWPDSLSAVELQRWQQFCYRGVHGSDDKNIDRYREELVRVATESGFTQKQQELIRCLEQWLDELSV
jgi:exodeoxyribonuclease I